jgi:hypothetical protein
VKICGREGEFGCFCDLVREVLARVLDARNAEQASLMLACPALLVVRYAG